MTAHKRYLHYLLKRVQFISSWYLVIIFVCGVGLSFWSLRQNSLQAVKLREAVMVADQNNQGLEEALRELRQYVYSHMNTSFTTEGGAYPPIQLKYQYERLVAAEKERASAANARLATEAQQHCERLIPSGRTSGRVACIQEFMSSRGATEQPIPDALYKFDFVPPRWSWDLAGLSILFTAVVGILLLLQLVATALIKRELSH